MYGFQIFLPFHGLPFYSVDSVLWCKSFNFDEVESSLMAQTVKNLPAMLETWVQSLGWEDPLGEEMATHSSILAWKISWTEESARLQSMGLQRVGHDWATNTFQTSYPFAQLIKITTTTTTKPKMEHFNLVIKYWRIDVFELWCWRRLLRVPWTSRSNQSIVKKINSEYSLEGLMLKLKLQYFGHLMGRTDWLEKTLILGKIEGGRRRGRQRMRWLDGIIDSMDMSLSTL